MPTGVANDAQVAALRPTRRRQPVVSCPRQSPLSACRSDETPLWNSGVVHDQFRRWGLSQGECASTGGECSAASKHSPRNAAAALTCVENPALPLGLLGLFGLRRLPRCLLRVPLRPGRHQPRLRLRLSCSIGRLLYELRSSPAQPPRPRRPHTGKHHRQPHHQR